MARKNKNAKSDEIRTPASFIKQEPDGTICIGSECTTIRIPPEGDIEIDMSECPENLKEIVSKKIIRGDATLFTMTKKSQQNENTSKN